jgi:hypothetical protein
MHVILAVEVSSSRVVTAHHRLGIPVFLLSLGKQHLINYSAKRSIDFSQEKPASQRKPTKNNL